jgi:hypothetical protein
VTRRQVRSNSRSHPLAGFGNSGCSDNQDRSLTSQVRPSPVMPLIRYHGSAQPKTVSARADVELLRQTLHRRRRLLNRADLLIDRHFKAPEVGVRRLASNRRQPRRRGLLGGENCQRTAPASRVGTDRRSHGVVADALRARICLVTWPGTQKAGRSSSASSRGHGARRELPQCRLVAQTDADWSAVRDHTGEFSWAFAVSAAWAVVALVAWGVIVGRVETVQWREEPAWVSVA